MTVELHKDKESCGGQEYSIAFNGSKLNKDLEFKFIPPVTVAAGDTLKLKIDEIAKALIGAYDAGKLNDESVSEYLKDTTEGSGSK